MPNPLNGVRVKIDRAIKHFADLDAAIKAFESREPYTCVMNRDPQSGHEIYRFCEREAIPIEWGAVLGDCVHNLRSALDFLAVALVEANGGTPGDYTAFPVGPDRTYFESSGIKRINGASADAIKLVRRLKPYRGGNDTVWRLHRLDIADKHQLLIPVAAAHKMLGIQYHVTDETTRSMPVGPMLRGPPTDRKFPLKNGDILLVYPRVRLPFEDHSKFDFAFEIAFGERQIFDGEPIIPTLTQLVDFTERLIDIFARRILGLNSW